MANGGTYGSYLKLPDVIATHCWQGNYPPLAVDGYIDNSNFVLGSLGKSEDLLKGMYETCSAQGYYPNFAITEYSYSAIPYESAADIIIDNVPYPISGTNGPIDINNDETQLNYFIQSKLTNATMGGTNAKFKYDLWFHHVMEPGNTIIQWATNADFPSGAFLVAEHGWFNCDFNDYEKKVSIPGTDRPIRYAARDLFSPTGQLRLCSDQFYPWISATANYSNLKSATEAVFNAWCGWKLVNQENNYDQEKTCWLAAWRFTNTREYYQEGNETISIEIDGNYTNDNNYQTTVYKFSIASDEYTQTAYATKRITDDYIKSTSAALTYFANSKDEYNNSLSQLTRTTTSTVTTFYTNNKTTIIITNVVNNPVFIKFEKN
jgi:hypothetical protein